MARQSPTFEWIGGHAALDFTNTVSWAGAERLEERLRSYADLIRWSREARLADAAEVRRLTSRAAALPGEAKRAHVRALRLREALHEVFIAQAEGRQPAPESLRRVNRLLNQALARLRLASRGARGWEWVWDGSELDRPLWRVAWDAARLLTSNQRRYLRRCAAERCGWVFLDRSRNHTRRWCDMRVCGNNEKARRYYRRRTGKRVG